MFNEFKKLSPKLKIIIGVIAFLMLPITLLLFSAELLVRSIKNKKKPGAIIAGILCFIFLSASGAYLSIMFGSSEDSSLQEKITSLESKITSLEDEITSKDSEIASLKEQLSSSNDEVETLESKIESLEEKLEESEASSDEDSTSSDASSTTSNSSTSSESYNSSSTSNANSASNSYSSTNSYSGSSSSSSQSSGEIVYCNGGKSTSNKYHRTPTAHNMEGAIKMTKQQAQAAGYVACKRCY